MSAPVGFMYAWHVRRQLRNWKTTLAFYWGLLIGVLVIVVFVCGTTMMAMHYLS
jgi:hypothetical protein